MNRQTTGPVLTALAAIVLVTFASRAQVADRTDVVRQAVVGGTARNIILFIGDGMGDSEITAARNYAVGAAGPLALERMLAHT